MEREIFAAGGYVAGRFPLPTQSGAKRLHGRARGKTLAEDHRWNKTLGFAGME
jgi:hypothetical protein